MRWLIYVTLPAALLLFLSVPGPLHAQSNGGPDIRIMAVEADFIFKGIVVEVEYRNSEFVPLLDTTGAPIYEEDQPVYADGSNLPHSFITYQILEVYKGKPPQIIGGPPSEVVTLQRLGGVDTDDPNSNILFEPHYPHMDIGDTDLLFVLGNTLQPCPLVGCERGRFRVITDPDDNEPKMYSDTGRELLHLPESAEHRDRIGFGRIHRYPEVMTYHFGCEGCMLEKVYVDDGDEHSDPGGQGDPPPEEPSPGPQFGEREFGSFVLEVVQQMHTQDHLDGLPPVVSANIRTPFEAQSFDDDGPEDFGPEVLPVYPRPWLDELPQEEREAILEAERVEAVLLELSGGNPVLPENECEVQILTEGAIAGDISGPEGKPDCYVNFFDVAAMGELWLECNNPEDPNCF